MTRTTYPGRVTAHGQLYASDRRPFLAYLRTLAGEDVEITVMKRRSKRSLSQNAWLHGVALPLIADHCGYDVHERERLHYDLLAKYFGTIVVSGLVPGAPTRIVPVKTSSQLTTKEFAEYMDWIVRFSASELGVVIPLPDDTPETVVVGGRV